MSPIVTMQRRVREVGRLRIGAQIASSNGRKRPAKLETFRFTSRDRRAVEAAAALYGGDVQPWSAPDGVEQWEVISKAAELSVIVPPTDMAWSQWLETWSAAGCAKRCDGLRDVLRDVACDCDPDNRECRITTRLSLMIPELPGTGLWRFESHGYYAGSELGGVVELLQQAAQRNAILPARLRLDQRSVKRLDPKGKPVTMRFVVPVLDVDMNLHALAAHQPAPDALSELPSRPSWSSVPELPEAPYVSVSDQLDEVEAERPSKRTSRSAAQIPDVDVEAATNVDTCPVCGDPVRGDKPVRKLGTDYVHVQCFAADDDEEPRPERRGQPTPENTDDARVGGTDVPAPDAMADDDKLRPSAEQRAMMQALAGRVLDVGPVGDPNVRRARQHQQRIALCSALGFDVTTTSDLTRGQTSKLIDALVAIEEGRYSWDGQELTPVNAWVRDVELTGDEL